VPSRRAKPVPWLRWCRSLAQLAVEAAATTAAAAARRCLGLPEGRRLAASTGNGLRSLSAGGGARQQDCSSYYRPRLAAAHCEPRWLGQRPLPLYRTSRRRDQDTAHNLLTASSHSFGCATSISPKLCRREPRPARPPPGGRNPASPKSNWRPDAPLGSAHFKMGDTLAPRESHHHLSTND
jgi:hypothetical protein